MFDHHSHDEYAGVAPDAEPAIAPSSPRSQVRVCQNTTCTQQGAAAVLQAFTRTATTSDVEVTASGCLGCCGNGPMVLIWPDDVWYSHVQVPDVDAIVTQHLVHGHPVVPLLDRTHHDPKSVESAAENAVGTRWAYGAIAIAVLVILASLGWTLWTWA